MVQEGIISKIIYQNEDNGYCVLAVETGDDDDIFVGNIPGAAEGMYIQADGEFVTHPQYDLQFKVNTFELSMPNDIEGITRFLASGVIKGIGEALAKRIVKMFREDTLRIIDEEPEKLAAVKGISKKMAGKIAASYNENRAYRDVIIFLSNYGISVKNAMKIYTEFGDETYKIIKENPYRIADSVPGIGFKTVDVIAMNAGIVADSEYRLSSAVIYSLNYAMSYGHMYMPEDELMTEMYELLGMDADMEAFSDRMHGILIDMSMNFSIKLVESDGKNLVYSYWNYKTEEDSARRLIELKSDYDVSREEVIQVIEQVEDETEIILADEQREAIIRAVSSGVSVITGGPGTGKTTIINSIIKYYEYRGSEVLLAAPTGRAAKRMTESTGYEARTIHRLLEFSGEPGEDTERVTLRFGRNEYNPLECDAIIIDEASMVDAHLFHALLKAITPGSRLVLVGDTDQLPPVGAGNVLHDIIDSDCFPVTILNKIFRQSDGSSIVENAHKIKNGVHLEINNKSTDFFFIPRKNVRDITNELCELVTDNLPGYLKVSPMDIEVLTPTRHYELGVEELNKRLQSEINPPSPGKREKHKGDVILREGDKVMQIKNNYKLEWSVYADEKRTRCIEQGVGVFNGDMGFVSQINDFDEVVTIEFDDGRVAEYDYSHLDELEHAYAITIHKSQGSEYPAVVIPIFTGPPKLLNRNLLYTAVTRAREMVVIVGNLSRINAMIDNVTEQKRYTGFRERIMSMVCEEETDEYMNLFEEDEMQAEIHDIDF